MNNFWDDFKEWFYVLFAQNPAKTIILIAIAFVAGAFFL